MLRVLDLMLRRRVLGEWREVADVALADEGGGRVAENHER
jgi:hypothetical protein